jgi:hypothetical protein
MNETIPGFDPRTTSASRPTAITLADFIQFRLALDTVTKPTEDNTKSIATLDGIINKIISSFSIQTQEPNS